MKSETPAFQSSASEPTARNVERIAVNPCSLVVICPNCGYGLDAWVVNPLGITYDCSECDLPFKVPTDLQVTVDSFI